MKQPLSLYTACGEDAIELLIEEMKKAPTLCTVNARFITNPCEDLTGESLREWLALAANMKCAFPKASKSLVWKCWSNLYRKWKTTKWSRKLSFMSEFRGVHPPRPANAAKPRNRPSPPQSTHHHFRTADMYPPTQVVYQVRYNVPPPVWTHMSPYSFPVHPPTPPASPPMDHVLDGGFKEIMAFYYNYLLKNPDGPYWTSKLRRALVEIKMSMSKTYGPRPQSFTLDDGERYFIGSEVGSYLKFHRGTLYKKYPQLWKKFATMEQKRRIQELQCTTTCINTNIMLVKANEIEEIFAGHEEKYRNSTQNSNPNPVRTESAASLKPSRSSTGTAYLGQPVQVSSGSHHLESVPCSTPVAHARGTMKPRDFAYCPEDVGEAYNKVMENADQVEDLIPIRLDMELDGVKLRDTFCYNKNDKIITPEILAEVICEDLELPLVSFHPAISQAIYQQIDAAGEAVPVEPQLNDQRAVLKLNIHVGNQSLVDQFEWDMSETNNSPEQFAQKVCAELALGGEFVPAVAYSVRGQLSWNLRTYAFSESPLPVIDNPYRNRPDVDQWGPFLETLTDAEIAKKMRNQDRNTRRIRRLAHSTPYGL